MIDVGRMLLAYTTAVASLVGQCMEFYIIATMLGLLGQ